jgi:hypothetical protein
MSKIAKTGVLVCMVLLWATRPVLSQDDDPKLFMSGYLKDMVITDFYISDNTLWTNLVHNRLNFKWYPNDKFSAFVEVRNQWYTGDYVKIILGFEDQIGGSEDFFNLSWTVASNENNVLHTMIDRIYVEYQSNDWNVRLGRQRINWGVSMIWNPNDLFNAYSYVDFDYEERPGSDALRIQKFTGFASSFEVAVNLADSLGSWVGATKWATNKWNYDFQVIGGLVKKDVAIGGAWAGNIKQGGFKGEFTYFIPVAGNDKNHAFVGTLSYDYSFKNSLYFNVSYLFNSDGALDLGSAGFIDFYYGELTARNLSPYMHSTFIMASYPFHPLINGSLAVMNFPGNKSMFVNPTVTFSLLEYLDLDLTGQVFYGEDLSGDFKSLSKVLYTRLKWSF